MSIVRTPGCLIEHDVDAVEPFGFDWTDWLADISNTETIASSAWSSLPSGLTLASSSIVTGNLKTQIKVSGGSEGTKYTITNSIVTSSGYHDDRSFVLLAVER